MLLLVVRDAQGGHRLARPAEQISLRDILTALDGPLLTGEPSRDHLSAAVPEDHELIDAL